MVVSFSLRPHMVQNYDLDLNRQSRFGKSWAVVSIFYLVPEGIEFNIVYVNPEKIENIRAEGLGRSEEFEKPELQMLMGSFVHFFDSVSFWFLLLAFSTLL